jgi:hypothetical protein
MKKMIIFFGAAAIGAMFFLKFVGTPVLPGTKKQKESADEEDMFAEPWE